MKGSRVPALLAGLAAALLTASCGVPRSGVIEAGEPASGMAAPDHQSPPPTMTPVYFLHGGEPRPYPREIDGPGDYAGAVRALFDGPSTSETPTATTELPRLPGPPEVTTVNDGTLSVRLPRGVPPLGRTALTQLVCTVAGVPRPPAPQPTSPSGAASSAATATPATPPSVLVHGTGWTTTGSTASCPDPA
ncbi:GerMN domain-containing protein [Streptomyces sp. NEAU-sy36]|uniref:GerMN domain-containing protein n=1 Tax=unclassified Streptomyces TaxID=2593676 RepID=UPI0015D5B57E|nr:MULTISPECIES: GerMN domain-containing protein [unclassified Streptomyces]QLJ05157.1 GerMN domain-containing protein [Streptomyces sp. NEAU-sy36]